MRYATVLVGKEKEIVKAALVSNALQQGLTAIIWFLIVWNGRTESVCQPPFQDRTRRISKSTKARIDKMSKYNVNVMHVTASRKIATL